MKIIVLILTSIYPILIFGQKTEEVVVIFYDSFQSKEEYSVLKSNEKLKHGNYIRYYKYPGKYAEKKFIKEKGNYWNGKKNGEWLYYSYPKKDNQGELIKTEIYENGIESGIWETHHYEDNAHIIEKFDYNLNTQIEPKIMVELKYPPLARELGIQGEVIIKLTQKHDCTFENITIIKSLNPKCDAEVIRRFRRISELQKKYGIEKCTEKEIIKTIEFKLN